MANKKTRFVGYIIITLISIFLYVLAVNWNFIVLKESNMRTSLYKAPDVVNWDLAEGVFYSKDDPQIRLKKINDYVSSVSIHCPVILGKIEPKLYYTTLPWEKFSEKKSIAPEFHYENNILTINVNKYVNRIRIDPTPGVGLSMNLYETTLHYDGIYVNNIYFLFFIFILTFVLYGYWIGWKKLYLYINDVKKYNYLLSNLIKKDITTKYRRTVLGVLWSIISPLVMMIVMTAVFQGLFKNQVKNFPIYYVSGLVIFNFASEATTGAMMSIVSARDLIQKVYIPKFIFPFEKCLFSMVNMLFSMISVLVLFTILKFTPPATIFLFPIPMLYTLIFCIGLGMILATMNVFFRDTGHLYGLFVTAWMFMTPILYPEEILSEEMLQIVKLNPLYYYIGYFREILLYGTIPSIETNIICILYSLFFLALGIIIFRRKQDRFILYM